MQTIDLFCSLDHDKNLHKGVGAKEEKEEATN